jgi:photosystem II stability/assembly factor-like uncharacterized protein
VQRTKDAGRSWTDCALPEPLPAMPYALLATEDRLFAGLADGQFWESRDRGDSWTSCALQGDEVGRILALAVAGG